MISLDPTTIIFMATLMAGAMSVVLYSAYLSFPKEIQGLREWSLGLICLVTGAVFFGMSGDGYTLRLCANLMLIGGLGLTLIGTERFYGVRVSWDLYSAVCVFCMLAIAYWMLITPNFSARVAAFSYFAFIFYARQVYLIWKYGEKHFSTRFFGSLMTFQAVVVFTRGLLATLSREKHINLQAIGPFQSIYLATGHFMILLMTVGFMTICTRRLQIILERRSTLDPLTQVLNRRGFADAYAKEHALMSREGTFMTMLNIDVDYFKKINDCHGHSVGDRVLVDVAEVIGKVVRASDHVARFGGEEFVVFLPATGLERALHIADRIQAALRQPRPDVPLYTVSIGVACQHSPEETLDGILIRADKAMYCAKEKGRDRIEVAPDAMMELHAMRA